MILKNKQNESVCVWEAEGLKVFQLPADNITPEVVFKNKYILIVYSVRIPASISIQMTFIIKITMCFSTTLATGVSTLNFLQNTTNLYCHLLTDHEKKISRPHANTHLYIYSRLWTKYLFRDLGENCNPHRVPVFSTCF